MGKSTNKHQHIHWQTPALLVSSLLIGIGLAIGHHAFYQSINGIEASSHVLRVAGVTTSQQQLVSVGGTALAFLFKASLIFCASVAYIQLFFRTVYKHTHCFQLDKLDQWFAALEDIRALFCITTYVRHPLLPLVAATAWLLPVAAVVSPAAISVVFDRIYPSPIVPLHVAQPAFESLTFLNYRTELNYFENATSLQAIGPSQEVSRIAKAVASGGTILPIEPPGSNTSWQVTIEAPSLSCDDAKGKALQNIKENIAEVVQSAAEQVYIPELGPAETQMMYTYMGWINEVPYSAGPNTSIYDIQDQRQISGASGSNWHFGIAVFPRTVNNSILEDFGGLWLNETRPPAWNGTENYTRSSHLLMDKYFEDATVLLCEARTANYTLQFSYINQEQSVDIISMEDGPRNIHNLSDFQTIDIAAPQAENLDMGYPGVYNFQQWGRFAMREWSYNALYLAMTNMVLGGNICTATWLGRSPEGVSTQIFDTILANTPEIRSITHAYQPRPEALINRTSGIAFEETASFLYASQDSPTEKPLKAALEELFFNITISTASSESLRYNESSPFLPQKVGVTFGNYGNVYTYDPEKLWLAYGIAIGVSILNVVVGLWAIFNTGAAFTANFSTVLRVAKNADIGTKTVEPVLPGKDPLPRRLGEAILQLNYGEQKMPP